ncbi:PH domain-containing protein [Mechercharimyces sp. CAU 1602]|uniref:PH domain-containing protein n=1 Tax=Mechercharimyces sp. CAU 1602 TaxID=2973933 RepID=UPI0021611F70|nr:PH domain-containing protein [Mechercharimyces sp. CAU 1602]MCS1351607.1 PH domain-containing protein [Mechercharimyces sp. CAU 1602]
MRAEPKHRIDEKALTVWYWEGVIIGLVLIGLFSVLIYALYRIEVSMWLTALVIPILVVIGSWMIWGWPKLRWKRWRYEVTENEIELQYGVWIVKRTLIPMVRVQHVDTKQGPLLRRYGLAAVMISTAAGTHEIPALEELTAELLRDRIAELARVIDDV